jgi:hypothetical protein
MKNEKAIYKYKHDDEVGFMHYVVYKGKVVVLSRIDSLKIRYVQDNNHLYITANIKGVDYQKVSCKVLFDKGYVNDVYQYMIETNNVYFSDGIDGLCAIVFES